MRDFGELKVCDFFSYDGSLYMKLGSNRAWRYCSGEQYTFTVETKVEKVFVYEIKYEKMRV